jgi:3-phosphoshikimate 1-carboxyvinyltransferase
MTPTAAPRIASVVRAPNLLRGEVVVPGDKSITHRAVMLNAIAAGTSTVVGAGLGGDCLSTVACMRALGATVRRRWPTGELTDDLRRDPLTGVEDRADAVLLIHGVGQSGVLEPVDVLDAGNSGTTARLLAGILSGQPFFSILTGDGSLRSRPMRRVVDPLRQMGARVFGRQGDSLLPLAIAPSSLHGAALRIPVASAQLKSCLLLAGLSADGVTEIEQPELSRDHTERLLAAMGARVEHKGLSLRVYGHPMLRCIDVAVPGDISSAAFWLVAGCIHPDARVTVRNVGVNPTRTGIVEVLRAMGGQITLANERLAGGEPIADVTAESSRLRGISVSGALIPRLVDEVPVLAVAAAAAEGITEIRDASELRFKESDRLAVAAGELARLGVAIEELSDGLRIQGGRISGGEARAHEDHRMAMALAIAGLVAGSPVAVEGAECVSISYPTFWQDLNRLAPGAAWEG